MGRICDSVPPWGHIERRRAAPESKYLGSIPMASLRDRAEIPRPSFAQGSGGQARFGMTVMQDHGFFAGMHRNADAPGGMGVSLGHWLLDIEFSAICPLART